MKIICLPIFLFLTASEILAQSAAQDSTSLPIPNAFAPSLFSIGIKLVLALGLIIGLIYLSTYFLKKLNSKSAGGANLGDAVIIMGRAFLSPKQCLYIVKIGSRYVVVGATDSSLNMISELSASDVELFEKKSSKPKDGQSPSKFADILKGIIRP